MTFPHASQVIFGVALPASLIWNISAIANHTTVAVSPEQPEPDRFISMGISGSSTNDFAGSIELTISLEGQHGFPIQAKLPFTRITRC